MSTSNRCFGSLLPVAKLSKGTLSDIVQLNEALEKSKNFVSSEIYAPNGNTNTDCKPLETSIDATPTIMSYDPKKPENAKQFT